MYEDDMCFINFAFSKPFLIYHLLSAFYAWWRSLFLI
jgi:hypothetical protein